MSPTESETTSPVTTATSGWGSLRGGITSSRHCVEVGIIIGCTISAKLFSLAMDVLIQSAEPECRDDVCSAPATNQGIHRWPQSQHRISTRLPLDSAGAQKDSGVGPDVLQTSQIQIFGAKERESWGQLPVQHWRHSNNHPSQRNQSRA